MWVVVKFGGTSVSSARSWGVIAQRVRQLEGRRVWITASALSQVSNRLERCIQAAVDDVPLTLLDGIEADHRDLAAEIGLAPTAFSPVEELLADLRRLLEGIRLTGEASHASGPA